MNFLDYTTILFLFTPSLNLPTCLLRKNHWLTTPTTLTRYLMSNASQWLGKPISIRMANSQYEKQLLSIEFNGSDYAIVSMVRSQETKKQRQDSTWDYKKRRLLRGIYYNSRFGDGPRWLASFRRWQR